MLLNYRMETQSQNIQMHFPVTVIMTIKPLIAFKCKAISTSNFTCKALHFSQSWFLVLFGKYVTCYEHFFVVLKKQWYSLYSVKLINFSAFLEFNSSQLLIFTWTSNLEMMELVSGTLAFLRQNPHLFFFFKWVCKIVSKLRCSITENIKSPCNTYRDSPSILKEKLKIEIWQHWSIPEFWK